MNFIKSLKRFGSGILAEKGCTPAYFVSRALVAEDTHILRFLLPKEEPLGFVTGDYIELSMELNGKEVTKYYHPISQETDKGFVDLLVKNLYSGNSSNSFSNKLSDLKEGQEVKISGPRGNLRYLGKNEFQRK